LSVLEKVVEDQRNLAERLGHIEAMLDGIQRLYEKQLVALHRITTHIVRLEHFFNGDTVPQAAEQTKGRSGDLRKFPPKEPNGLGRSGLPLGNAAFRDSSYRPHRTPFSNKESDAHTREPLSINSLRRHLDEGLGADWENRHYALDLDSRNTSLRLEEHPDSMRGSQTERWPEESTRPA